MISCTFKTKEKQLLAIMFKKKERLQNELSQDPTKKEAYLRQRDEIVKFILKRLKPALEARIKTWTARHYCDEADARSLVYEHVLITVEKYKPSKGNCSVTSFLWTVSNRALSNFVNAAKRQKRDPQSAMLATVEDVVVPVDVDVSTLPFVQKKLTMSLDEPAMYGEEGHSLTLADVVPDSERMEDQLSASMLLQTIYSQCNEQQRSIVQLLQENYTYKEIADQLNTTTGIISRQIQQLRKKLKYGLPNY